MIYKGTLKVEAFLRAVSLHVSPEEKPAEKFADKGYTYLGAGYWRCRPVWNTERKIVGLKLLNRSFKSTRIYQEAVLMNSKVQTLKHPLSLARCLRIVRSGLSMF